MLPFLRARGWLVPAGKGPRRVSDVAREPRAKAQAVRWNSGGRASRGEWSALPVPAGAEERRELSINSGRRGRCRGWGLTNSDGVDPRPFGLELVEDLADGLARVALEEPADGSGVEAPELEAVLRVGEGGDQSGLLVKAQVALAPHVGSRLPGPQPPRAQHPLAGVEVVLVRPVLEEVELSPRARVGPRHGRSLLAKRLVHDAQAGGDELPVDLPGGDLGLLLAGPRRCRQFLLLLREPRASLLLGLRPVQLLLPEGSLVGVATVVRLLVALGEEVVAHERVHDQPEEVVGGGLAVAEGEEDAVVPGRRASPDLDEEGADVLVGLVREPLDQLEEVDEPLVLDEVLLEVAVRREEEGEALGLGSEGGSTPVLERMVGRALDLLLEVFRRDTALPDRDQVEPVVSEDRRAIDDRRVVGARVGDVGGDVVDRRRGAPLRTDLGEGRLDLADAVAEATSTVVAELPHGRLAEHLLPHLPPIGGGDAGAEIPPRGGEDGGRGEDIVLGIVLHGALLVGEASAWRTARGREDVWSARGKSCMRPPSSGKNEVRNVQENRLFVNRSLCYTLLTYGCDYWA